MASSVCHRSACWLRSWLKLQLMRKIELSNYLKLLMNNKNCSREIVKTTLTKLIVVIMIYFTKIKVSNRPIKSAVLP
jgi:hypothetical protein